MPQALPLMAMMAIEAGIVEGMAAFALMAASSVVAGVMAKSMAKDTVNWGGESGIQVNTRSTTEILPVVIGEMLVAGNDVFIEATGENNKDLWIVQTLSDDECDSISQVGGVDQVLLDGKLPSEFGGNVSYWFHNGSNSQTVDTNLAAAVPKWTDAQRNTCYIVFKLTFDRNYFNSLPTRKVLLRGRKFYDFRDESTAWSQNHILAVYDYFTNDLYGFTGDAAKIDIPSWTAAANYVDTMGWKLNHALTGGGAKDIMDAMLILCRCQMTTYANKLYMRYADLNYETSVKTITDAHIVQGDDGRGQIGISQPSKFGKPQSLKGWYLDPDKEWAADAVTVGESAVDPEEMTLYGSTDRQHITTILTYNLERRQLDRLISGLFRDSCQGLEPHDVVTLNSTELSVSDLLCRVDSAAIQQDGLVPLTLKLENIALYNEVLDLDVEGVYKCNLPDKDMQVPSVSNVEVSEELYGIRLRSNTRVLVSFSDPANYPWFSHVEVWLSGDDVTYTHQFDTDDNFYLEPVKEGQSLYIRLKTVSIHGRKTADTSDYKYYYVVTGQASVPDSLGSLEAVVNQNSINLFAAKLESDDIELYEFRLGTSWVGAIFLSALRSPNLSLNGVKPGDHTFLANTFSTNKQYGSTPRSKSASMIDPPDGWSITNTETCDYNGVGTHDNTEHVTYASDDYLKCSHTGGLLVGTYSSPIYDRGASARYMVYCLAETVIIGTGTTWDDQIPDPVTWDEIGISSRTWNQIFELSAAPQIKIKMLHGDTSPPTNEVERLEILSAIVTARYFQFVIEITDPSSEINALFENFTAKFCQ